MAAMADPFAALGAMSSSTVAPTTTAPSSLGSILLRALIVFIVIMIALIFIHFTIRPIFKTTPDSPGIISTPSPYKEDKVFWQTKEKVTPLPVSSTPIGSSDSGYNYSLTLDIQIDDAHKYDNLPRILFYKGGQLKTTQPAKKDKVSVASMIDNPSLIFSLTRDTNDLHIAVVTQKNDLEGVLLYNVPLRQSFRVGVVLSDKRLEVYTNGLLSRTRALTNPPKAVQGTFWPSPLSGIQLRNLHIWPYVVAPQEMRAALPALSAASFDAPSLQETCAATATATANAFEAVEKLVS
jgi:hypothetical protein